MSQHTPSTTIIKNIKKKIRQCTNPRQIMVAGIRLWHGGE
jgi:hypothetical protein